MVGLPDLRLGHDLWQYERGFQGDKMVSLLGVVIANGFSPENRAFAGFLGRRDGFSALVVHHQWSGDEDSAPTFAASAHTRLLTADFGWRPNPTGRRILIAKVWSQFRLRFLMQRLPRAIRSFNPDVVYSSGQRWDCLAASHVADSLKIPQIIHLHYPIGWWLGRHVQRRLRECEAVIAVSDFIGRELVEHGVRRDRIHVVRYAIDLAEAAQLESRILVRRDLGIEDDCVVVGMIARLDRSKGQIETIQAFGQLARTHPRARLVVVGGQLQAGSGISVDELRRLADATGFGDRIVITGHRPNAARLLGGFDIFSHPSRKDASPYAVIEASAAGLPVVAWKDGGMAEIVKDGETGLLAPLDDVGGLAQRLDQLIGDATAARAMGAAGRERVKALFDPDQNSARFAGVVRQVTAERQRPSSRPSHVN